ncbi:MAG: hypothetical protein AAB415_01830 [Patescibacteria group bacterium]
MQTLTIPKSLTGRDDLVVIPRRDYEQLVSDSSQEIIKRDPKIDRALAISMRQYREGKVEGPFNNAAQFMAFLRKKPRRSKVK